jgi:hypothetical protein
MQAYKPGSVEFAFTQTSLIIYLALLLPLGLSAYPPRYPLAQIRTSRSFHRGLFGLSTRKVYPATFVTKSTVGSYPTFSLSPPEASAKGGYLFSVALSVAPPRAGHLPVRKYDALCCPDFPWRVSATR